MGKDFWTYVIYGVTIISAGFIAFVKDIAEKKPKLKFLRYLKFRIPLAILLGTLTIIGTSRISSINEENKRLQDSLSEKNKKSQDSLSEKNLTETIKLYSFKNDSNSKERLKIISDALGKYGYKFDSVSKELKKRESPVISLCDLIGVKIESIKSDSLIYTINLCSYSASAIVKDATSYALYLNSEPDRSLPEPHYLSKTKLFTTNLLLDKNSSTSQRFVVKSISKVKVIVILLKGHYTDSDGKNIKEIEQVGFVNLLTNRFGFLASPLDDQVKSFLKSKGVM